MKVKSYYIKSNLRIISETKKEIICFSNQLNTPLYFINRKSFSIFKQLLFKFQGSQFKIRFTFKNNRKILRFITPIFDIEEISLLNLSPSPIFFKSQKWKSFFDFTIQQERFATSFKEKFGQCSTGEGVFRNGSVEDCFDLKDCAILNQKKCLFCEECLKYDFSDDQELSTVENLDQLQLLFNFIISSINESQINGVTIPKPIIIEDKRYTISYSFKRDFCDCRTQIIHFLLLKFGKDLLKREKKIRTNIVLAPFIQKNELYYKIPKSSPNEEDDFWNFHVAPCISIGEKDYVFDPLVSPFKPIEANEWFKAFCPLGNPKNIKVLKTQGWVIKQNCIGKQDSICSIPISGTDLLRVLGLNSLYNSQKNSNLSDITTITIL